MTDYAFNGPAVKQRRRKAMVVARHLHEQRTAYFDVLLMTDEEPRKQVEKAAGVTTKHRDELWALVVDAFEWLLEHEPHPEPEPEPPAPLTRPCGCPLAGRVFDEAKHRAYHDLVAEQAASRR